MPYELPTTWESLIEGESVKLYMQRLALMLAAEREKYIVLPDESLVLRAFAETPLDQVRVVVLGQDPYPTPPSLGVAPACGLSFAVPPGVPPQHSLKEILREMREDLNQDTDGADFGVLASRGALLLNTTLTVRANCPGSHVGLGWEEFARAALTLVAAQPRQIGFLLMGTKARATVKGLDLSRHVVVQTPHPACRPPLTFRGTRPFSRMNQMLEQPFDWRLR